MGSIVSAYTSRVTTSKQASNTNVEEDDLLDERDREEDIAQFPYVEFTGRDSITCPSCQGTGCIPTEQVNELVALIPYSDQRLQPQRTAKNKRRGEVIKYYQKKALFVGGKKGHDFYLRAESHDRAIVRKLYVVLSVLMCLFICGLVMFFLFPRTLVAEDGGIRMVRVWFDKENAIVNLAMTSTLRFTNSNFYAVSVDSLISQVQYMNTVIGTQQQTNVSVIQPLSEKLVNFTVKLELGGILSYLYNFCTLSTVKVHNIVVFVRTSVKFSYVGHTSQSSLETYQYIDCGANSTLLVDHHAL